MSLLESTFDDVFWLTFSGALFGFGGMCMQAVLKSRCKEFHCCGMGCIRDVAPVGEEPDLELGRAPLATAATPTTNVSRTPPIQVRI